MTTGVVTPTRRPNGSAVRGRVYGLHLRKCFAGRFCARAFQLPHNIAAKMKSQPTTVAVVLNLVLDLSVGDELAACDALMPGAVTSFDAIRHVTRQPTVLNVLANVQP